MSHFSWKKYSFVANYTDKIALLIFDVKHFPGVVIFFCFFFFIRGVYSLMNAIFAPNDNTL